MKLATKFMLTLCFINFYLCAQDLSRQQVPGAEALTAKQIATSQEYADFQKSMQAYSLAALNSDSAAFEDRLQELSRQGKLIFPLEAEQFPSINNAAVYAAVLNNLECEFKILEEKFDWKNLDHDFKLRILDIYFAENPDVFLKQIRKSKGID